MIILDWKQLGLRHWTESHLKLKFQKRWISQISWRHYECSAGDEMNYYPWVGNTDYVGKMIKIVTKKCKYHIYGTNDLWNILTLWSSWSYMNCPATHWLINTSKLPRHLNRTMEKLCRKIKKKKWHHPQKPRLSEYFF